MCTRVLGVLTFILFYLFIPAAYGAEPVLARYVRIDLPGDARVLSLAEVQVYSGNKLISQLGKAKQVTTFRTATADKAIDGKTSGMFSEGSVTSTEPGSFVWWELDLGTDQEITKIVIYNRTDCCAERINPAHIALRNSTEKIVWQGNIESTQSRYIFNVNQASTNLTPVGRNLLRNATFKLRTNPLLPDYWDLHHAAALEFKDLYSHYGVDVNATPPLQGVDVLKIVNSEADFRYDILMPTKIESSLPGGDYTFSVYVKADRPAAISVAKAWAVGKEVTKKVSTDWQRYTFTFNEPNGAGSLQPVMFFPKKGTYFVAAPQLEEGTIATPFDAQYGGGIHQSSLGLIKQKVKTWVRSNLIPDPGNREIARKFQAMTEYDYYTSQNNARLWLSSPYSADIKADVVCQNARIGGKTFYKNQVRISPESALYLDVPIKGLPVGRYHCSVNAQGMGINATVSDMYIKKLSPSPLEVRSNAVKRFLTVNNVPFYIIGIYVIGGNIPDWYFKDIKDHGINTVFYNREPNLNGEYDLKNIKAVVTEAAKYDLKVVVGLSMAGAKPADWRSKTNEFLALMGQLKGYPQIIGWYPVDEPSANTWLDSELLEVYFNIKRADPYRFVFVNWAADGVPKQVGQQPRGTLGATDVYAMDYYPFTSPGTNLEEFTETTRSAALTADLYNKPFLSWLQIFGGVTASREPTAAELNYMAFTNFIYDGMISYWDTKSNSATTWERLKEINLQGAWLAQTLLNNENANQILPPVATEQFLYTAWKKEKVIFLIVLNRDAESREFSYDLSVLTHRATVLSVQSMFEKRSLRLNSHIDEKLAPYESKVYEIVLK